MPPAEPAQRSSVSTFAVAPMEGEPPATAALHKSAADHGGVRVLAWPLRDDPIDEHAAAITEVDDAWVPDLEALPRERRVDGVKAVPPIERRRGTPSRPPQPDVPGSRPRRCQQRALPSPCAPVRSSVRESHVCSSSCLRCRPHGRRARPARTITPGCGWGVEDGDVAPPVGSAAVITPAHAPKEPELERRQREHRDQDECDRQQHQDAFFQPLSVVEVTARSSASSHSPTNATIRRGRSPCESIPSQLTRAHWCSVDGKRSLAVQWSARYGQTAPCRDGMTPMAAGPNRGIVLDRSRAR